MLSSLVNEEDEEQKNTFATEYIVLLVKLPCAVALHLRLYPQVNQGMMIMKYANNQSDKFTNNGAEVSYIIGYFQFMVALYCEAINVYLLTNQQEVEKCIINFVALEVIMQLPRMYFESLSDN